MLKPLPPRPARGIRYARALALFAIVVAGEAVLARRFDLIDTVTLFANLAAVFVIAILALLCVVVALADVWRKAAPGLGSAVFSGVLVVLVLAPFVGAAAAVAVYPNLSEVSTDLQNPPNFVVRPSDFEPILGGAAVGTEAARLQQAGYPDLLSRRLPLSTVEAHALAKATVSELGWRVLAEREPSAEGEPGQIECEARTLVLSVPIDVVVRVWPDPGGSRIDLRSANRLPVHDLGENARRVRTFFASLDEMMTRPAD